MKRIDVKKQISEGLAKRGLDRKYAPEKQQSSAKKEKKETITFQSILHSRTGKDMNLRCDIEVCLSS